MGALVAAWCLLASVVRAEEFFPVRDENPLLRGFYLPLPSDSGLPDGANLAAILSLSNTLNVENRGQESLLVDGESATLRLMYENALSHSWRYRFSVPIIHDSGGFLDQAVDTWHQIFGLSRGNRPFYPKGQIDYSYSGRGAIELHQPQTSVGDLAAEAGWYAFDDLEHSVSIWGGVEAPTGSVRGLTSDGAWDGALWAHGAMRWTHWRIGAELGIAQPFGDELFNGFAHKISAFGRFAATRDLGTRWSLRAQLEGQTARVNDSELRLLGPRLQLTLGAVRRLSRRWRLEMGFTEDAAVNTAPDITFFLGIRR
jgi:hypothetical protein